MESRSAAALLTVVALLAGTPAVAEAYANGISSTRCGACHAGESYSTSGTVGFGSTAVVGEPVSVTVAVVPGNTTTHPRAGFNLTMGSGAFSYPPASSGARWVDTVRSVTHTAPRSSRTWTVTWTPSVAGWVSYTLWPNAVNYNGASTGDISRPLAIGGSVYVRRGDGAACSFSSQCGSGYCVDGVCCSSACTGGCHACSPTAGGSASAGTCSQLSDTSSCCPSGYRWNGTGCEEVNECVGANDCCRVGLRGCSAAASCENETGGYVCRCASGYGGDGFSTGSGCTTCPPGTASNWNPILDETLCQNVNECSTASCGAGTCSEIPLSVWTSPGYTCSCNPGYEQVDSPSRTCADVDECARGTDDCDPNALCANLTGGFACACNDGWTGDGTSCADVDECADPTFSNQCSSVARCVNAPGSWECVCEEGFRGDGFTCEDVDECGEDIDECDPAAVCINTNGGYACECGEGYRGSGFSCADVDECAEGTHGCDVTERCVNQLGATNTCVCRVGYVRAESTGECVVACGDGVRTPGEMCDDGNASAGDGCGDDCQIEPGWACIEPTGGESHCTETCGDALIHETEECDDGADNDDAAPDACRTNCKAAACGDAVLDTGEACDEGAANSDADADACRTSCQPAFCGDAVVDSGERCDPGGGAALAAAACTMECAPDGGVEGPPVADGGCGCRATGGSRDGFGGPLAILALLGLAWRRTTRRRAR